MMLYIAEKPSLGRAIAAVMPKPQHKEQGCIRLANGDVVSWCIGHLLEQAEPEDYDPQFKKWQAAHLPIVPEQWQLKARKGCTTQLKLLKQLIKQADQLVHAGDPDREGQLLVDEVLAWAGASHAKIAATQRLLINDLNPAAVSRALAQMKPNNDFKPLSVSALARSRADWLYGLNLTRAYTLQGQKGGYKGVLSVGRVQTPVLGLVVRRDNDIADFVSKSFYQVLAHLQTETGEPFTALWQPSIACEPYQDEDGRVLVRELAAMVQRKITNQPAQVEAVERKQKKQAPPLPYNLSTLQIDAARRFGLSAQQVLDCCQQLYEQHQLITYPRSDNRYLPVAHFADATKVSQAIAVNQPELQGAVQAADLNRRSKAWDDSKVEAHHAIIPTVKQVALSRLTATEQKIYQLIATQYLAQFYADAITDEVRATIMIAKGVFKALANTERVAGWRVLFRKEEVSNSKGAKVTDDNTDVAVQTSLPALIVGQTLRSLQGELLEKQTQPPKHFTDATLLAAMTGIARYVTDPAIRKVLKETDGLGTEATRAGIIELLFKRGYIQRQGKQILATLTGKALIAALPESAALPDMTAQWEAALTAISQRQQSYQQFMAPLLESLQQMIVQAGQSVPEGLPQGQTLSAGRAKRRITRKGYRKNTSPYEKRDRVRLAAK
ncbi:DNA topoisomerase 3 [Alishewanella longhuensis]|uniref:DNA topoisomerase n=1 Tax=Alishewanella longhuensis TaxID=1091037 RepID=A0ABQ3KVG4_9ALTE|nr:DNA topoisomerase III [Alishewanella longhuensis]GHG59290.1 DNA topoisomerase 3 [Alishewanella longhuensis]